MGLYVCPRAAWYNLSAVCITRHTRIIPSTAHTLPFLCILLNPCWSNTHQSPREQLGPFRTNRKPQRNETVFRTEPNQN